MAQESLYAILSVIVVSLISLIGVFTLSLNSKMGVSLLKFLVGFSAGALLGDVFIHLLPEMAEENQINFSTSLTILGAIVVFFILERYIHWHHHHSHAREDHATHPFVFLNLIGDGLHNLIDGLIIGGAFLIDIQLGFVTTMAVVLHEIPQEFGDFGILIYGGLSRGRALFYNFLTGLMAVLGVLIALAVKNSENLVAVLGALGVGSFIYIALADLVPEIHKEKKQAFSQFLTFLLGIGVMFVLLFIE